MTCALSVCYHRCMTTIKLPPTFSAEFETLLRGSDGYAISGGMTIFFGNRQIFSERLDSPWDGELYKYDPDWNSKEGVEDALAEYLADKLAIIFSKALEDN